MWHKIILRQKLRRKISLSYDIS